MYYKLFCFSLAPALIFLAKQTLAQEETPTPNEFEVNWSAAQYPRPKVRVDISKHPGWKSNLRVAQDLQVAFDKLYVTAYAESFCKHIKPVEPCLERFQTEMARRERWVLSRKLPDDLVPKDASYFDSNIDPQTARAMSVGGLAREMVLASAVHQGQKYLEEFDQSIEAAGLIPKNLDALDSTLTRAKENIAALRAIAAPQKVTTGTDFLAKSDIKLGAIDLSLYIWIVGGLSIVTVFMSFFSKPKRKRRR